MITLDFLKEILSTYASLNRPPANVYFEFDIVEFDRSINPQDFMRSHFALKDNKELAVTEISESEFKQIIYKWFFEYGTLKNSKLDTSENLKSVDNFYSQIKLMTQEKKIFRFQNVNKGLYEYQLGIFFAYIYIEGQGKNFLIYFSEQG